MPATISDHCHQPSFADRAKRSVPYLIKAVIVLAVLFLVSRTAPLMPAWGIALCWAILSAVSSIAFAYPFVINKIRRQFTLEKGGMLARLNEGRTVTLIAGFVLAAVCTAGLILEMPKWGALEWALAVLAVPLYLAVFALINRWLGKEYTPALERQSCGPAPRSACFCASSTASQASFCPHPTMPAPAKRSWPHPSPSKAPLPRS